MENNAEYGDIYYNEFTTDAAYLAALSIKSCEMSGKILSSVLDLQVIMQE